MNRPEPAEESSIPARSERRLAELAAEIASVVEADVVVCASESGELARLVREEVAGRRIVVATPSEEIHRRLQQEGVERVHLPARVSDRFRQARVALGVAFREGKIRDGEVAVCVVGHRTSIGGGDLALVTDVEEASVSFVVSDLIRLTDGIRPQALNRILEIAARIGKVIRRGKKTGALFVIGDSDRVLEKTRQLVMNPFEGHAREARMVTGSEIEDTLVELAKLDGAFVVRGDGLIRTAGAHLTWEEGEVEVPAGLGTRHVAAAAVTARTAATAVAVSETDGYVRVFSGGKLTMEMDPELAVL